MNVEVRVHGSIEDVVERLQAWLVGEGFAFMETDKSYLIDTMRRPAQTVHSGSTYWARKQLAGAHPSSHALELVGDVQVGDGVTILRSRIVEYHGQREHTYGGSHALEDFVKAFCAAWSVAK